MSALTRVDPTVQKDVVDLLIVHKFDPSRPAPGGIDTCIRGILEYASPDVRIAVVGVAADDRPLGRWEQLEFAGRSIRFMPVAHLDPGDQTRRRPHSLWIALGLLRHRRAIGGARRVQAHRADLALLVSALWRGTPLSYFIHTQESGILGAQSDSIWRRAANVHRIVERSVSKRSDAVRVFNPTYAEVVQRWNSNARFSPTWWNPALVQDAGERRDRRSLLWVGRLEVPKRPELALEAFAALRERSEDWSMQVVGAGNLLDGLQSRIDELGLADSVQLVGRLRPEEVAHRMATSGVLLMTSVPGYEGYPRVLVEGLASGLPAVVTAGADTGGLVSPGVNGYPASDDPADIAAAIARAGELDESDARRSVAHLAAPAVVEALYR